MHFITFHLVNSFISETLITNNNNNNNNSISFFHISTDRLYGLVVRVPGYRSRGPGSIPGSTRFSDKQWVLNGVHSAS
jgi:hypothetical protein